LRFFLDNNLAPKLARGFHQFVLGEHEVVHLRDRFSQETPDVEWMHQLADESGWVIISVVSVCALAGAISAYAGLWRDLPSSEGGTTGGGRKKKSGK
jgi:hypothetical protein